MLNVCTHDLSSRRRVTANPNEMRQSTQLWDKGVWLKPKSVQSSHYLLEHEGMRVRERQQFTDWRTRAMDTFTC